MIDPITQQILDEWFGSKKPPREPMVLPDKIQFGSHNAVVLYSPNSLDERNRTTTEFMIDGVKENTLMILTLAKETYKEYNPKPKANVIPYCIMMMMGDSGEAGIIVICIVKPPVMLHDPPDKYKNEILLMLFDEYMQPETYKMPEGTETKKALDSLIKKEMADRKKMTGTTSKPALTKFAGLIKNAVKKNLFKPFTSNVAKRFKRR